MCEAAIKAPEIGLDRCPLIRNVCLQRKRGTPGLEFKVLLP